MSKTLNEGIADLFTNLLNFMHALAFCILLAGNVVTSEYTKSVLDFKWYCIAHFGGSLLLAIVYAVIFGLISVITSMRTQLTQINEIISDLTTKPLAVGTLPPEEHIARQRHDREKI